MSPTSDLLTGLAQFLADQGVVTYRSDGSAYAASETGVVFGLMPQTPDRVVCLTDYPVNDDAANPWSQVRVQIRTRGVPNDPLDNAQLRDAVNTALQSKAALTFGSVTVAQALRISSIPMGIDDNRRFEYADNYQFDVQLPSTANRP